MRLAALVAALTLTVVSAGSLKRVILKPGEVKLCDKNRACHEELVTCVANCTIKCTGRDSCYDLVVNSTSGTARVICGKFGCGWGNYNRGMYIGANAVAECSGDHSCKNIVSEHLNNTLKCSGKHSCMYAKVFSAHKPTVLCSGQHACKSINILGNPSLVCEARDSCSGFHAQLECHDARPNTGRPNYMAGPRGSWFWRHSHYINATCHLRKGRGVPDGRKALKSDRGRLYYLSYLHRRTECAASLGLCSNSPGSELSGEVVCSGVKSCRTFHGRHHHRSQLDGRWNLDCKGAHSCGFGGNTRAYKTENSRQIWGLRVSMHGPWQFFYLPAWLCATHGSCDVGCNGQSSCTRVAFRMGVKSSCRGALSCASSNWQVSGGKVPCIGPGSCKKASIACVNPTCYDQAPVNTCRHKDSTAGKCSHTNKHYRAALDAGCARTCGKCRVGTQGGKCMLECSGQGSCDQTRISGVPQVKCSGLNSCRKTVMTCRRGAYNPHPDGMISGDQKWTKLISDSVNFDSHLGKKEWGKLLYGPSNSPEAQSCEAECSGKRSCNKFLADSYRSLLCFGSKSCVPWTRLRVGWRNPRYFGQLRPIPKGKKVPGPRSSGLNQNEVLVCPPGFCNLACSHDSCNTVKFRCPKGSQCSVQSASKQFPSEIDVSGTSLPIRLSLLKNDSKTVKDKAHYSECNAQQWRCSTKGTTECADSAEACYAAISREANKLNHTISDESTLSRTVKQVDSNDQLQRVNDQLFENLLLQNVAIQRYGALCVLSGHVVHSSSTTLPMTIGSIPRSLSKCRPQCCKRFFNGLANIKICSDGHIVLESTTIPQAKVLMKNDPGTSAITGYSPSSLGYYIPLNGVAWTPGTTSDVGNITLKTGVKPSYFDAETGRVFAPPTIDLLDGTSIESTICLMNGMVSLAFPKESRTVSIASIPKECTPPNDRVLIANIQIGASTIWNNDDSLIISKRGEVSLVLNGSYSKLQAMNISMFRLSLDGVVVTVGSTNGSLYLGSSMSLPRTGLDCTKRSIDRHSAWSACRIRDESITLGSASQEGDQLTMLTSTLVSNDTNQTPNGYLVKLQRSQSMCPSEDLLCPQECPKVVGRQLNRVPSSAPTYQPTDTPTSAPTRVTKTPTGVPTSVPTNVPTRDATDVPADAPTHGPHGSVHNPELVINILGGNGRDKEINTVAKVCILSGKFSLNRVGVGVYTARLDSPKGNYSACFPKFTLLFPVKLLHKGMDAPAVLRLEPHGGVTVSSGPYFVNGSSYKKYEHIVNSVNCKMSARESNCRCEETDAYCLKQRFLRVKEAGLVELERLTVRVDNIIYSADSANRMKDICTTRCVPSINPNPMAKPGDPFDQGCVKQCSVTQQRHIYHITTTTKLKNSYQVCSHRNRYGENINDSNDSDPDHPGIIAAKLGCCYCDMYKKLQCFARKHNSNAVAYRECLQQKELVNDKAVEGTPCYEICQMQVIGF